MRWFRRRGWTAQLAKRERIAFHRIRSRIEPVLTTVRKAHELLHGTLSALLESDDGSLPRRMAIKLLIRIERDLRCATLASVQGYPGQAAALAATICEVAWTVAYVGDDEARANAWFQFNDPTRVFCSVRTMIDDVVPRRALPDENAVKDKHYSTYRQLCMVKHANPLLENQFGVEVNERRARLIRGPVDDDTAFRVAWYSLANGSGLVVHACNSALNLHVPAEKAASLRKSEDELNQRLAQHVEFAKRQGWASDPCPGQWRLFSR